MSRASGPLASNHGSSSIPLSKLMWRRLRSIEYGFETLASTAILFSLAKAIIFGASGKLPAKFFVAPRCDHFQFRRQGSGGELKTHLVVPLPRRAVGYGVG